MSLSQPGKCPEPDRRSIGHGMDCHFKPHLQTGRVSGSENTWIKANLPFDIINQLIKQAEQLGMTLGWREPGGST